MFININDCDFNNDYFHFTNKENISNILNNGLLPTNGPASQLVKDKANVSVSQGRKGILGILNSFIFVFTTEVKISDIPEEYKKYFSEISDFNSNDLIPKDIVYKGMSRKLKDEVYFRVEIDDKQLEKAKIGGLTGYDIKLPMAIDKSKLQIVTDENNDILTAYDVAFNIYEKVKNIEIFKEMNEDFFAMFEFIEKNKDNNLAGKTV